MSKVSPSIALSESDLKLVRVLETNPRITYTELASRMGVSRTTATAMLQRLRGKGMDSVCFVDNRLLGYTFSTLFCIQTTPGAVLDVAGQLAALPQTRTVFVCSGPFDIVCLGVFQDLGVVPAFLQGLGAIHGISRCETVACEEIKPNPPVRAAERDGRPAGDGRGLDDSDQAIIDELRRDARITVTHLAGKLGSSRVTVLRKMNRLLDSGIVRLVTVWGPYFVGSRCIAIVGLKAAPSQIKEVAQALASYSRIPGVQLCSGRYEVVAWVVFKDHQELIDFLVEEVGKIPGITSMETSIGLKLIKA